ncbi:uncharacterized protein LOC111263184 [Varroa jacobsoni]|uniref:uncharacterized protein LOC111263184 n=1 Tax=Varroa jacobsoni TaxID=62625 RepID=UPI000BF49F46|nr:uncharacterized protein LOC111263184 [Varroa jacobsoni]
MKYLSRIDCAEPQKQDSRSARMSFITTTSLNSRRRQQPHFQQQTFRRASVASDRTACPTLFGFFKTKQDYPEPTSLQNSNNNSSYEIGHECGIYGNDGSYPNNKLYDHRWHRCASSSIINSMISTYYFSNSNSCSGQQDRRKGPSLRHRQSPHLLSIAFITIAAAALMTPCSVAWNLHSSLSNVSATYHAARHEFHVYLLPEEILDYIRLPKFNCDVAEEQAYITKSGGNATMTILQWNHHVPAEGDILTIALDCSKQDDVTIPKFSAASNHSDRGRAGTATTKRKQYLEVFKNLNESTPLEYASVLPLPSNAKARRRRSAISTASLWTTVSAQGKATKASTTPLTTTTTTTATATATPVTVVNAQSNSASVASPDTSIEQSIVTTAEYLSTSTLNAVSQIDLAESKRQTGNQTDIMESTHFTRNDMAVITEVAFSNNVTINETIKLPPPNHFSLVITRLSFEFVQAQTLNSLEDVENITGDMERLLTHGNESRCIVLPKDVRSVNRRYVLLAVVEASSGEVIRAGDMLNTCGQEDWMEASQALPDLSRLRMLNSKNFQLQILCVTLAAAVVVFALSAVFLCTKWRLAVRRFRRDASDGFTIKTFHTQEHHYRPDDDDHYGFPTIPRDSTFYRQPNEVGGRPGGRCGVTEEHGSMGRSSFVNGGFHEESAEGLPPPPPELRACLIDDAHFTDVPLHNLAPDSLDRTAGARRGVRTSPPVPPVRTISSGYNTTSGQSSPASPSMSPLSPVSPEYDRPHEVLNMMPPIPKEDYSDSDDDDSGAVTVTGAEGRRSITQRPYAGQQEKDQRDGRFTVRTVL